MLFTTLALAQRIGNVIQQLDYQIVGIIVVMLCLGGLSVILSASGSIAAAIQNRKKALAEAAAKAAQQKASAPVVPQGGTTQTMPPEMLALISAAVDAAMTELTPELIAVISAAVDAGLDGVSHRIVEIKHAPGSAYASAGRAEIFASHNIPQSSPRQLVGRIS
jgi:uncharacterized ion transporter superfamily protein YfcC